jgi:GMP synthase-like glutamine amidotransferase
VRVHYLQHVPFEGLGSIGPWLEGAGHRISGSRLYASPELPSPGSIDALVVMGGPMSVNDEGEYPWLAREKRLVRDAIDSGKPVLGICLGAQLIASALGSKVYRNAEREIGWSPVEGISSDDPSLFRFPPTTLAFHWHGETFDLPPGATRIARSAACGNQAFQLGGSALALQFHLETTPESARLLVKHCRDELTPSTFVQSEELILSAKAEAYAIINQEMARVLSFLFGSAQPTRAGPLSA